MTIPIEFFSPGELFLRCLTLVFYVPAGVFVCRRILPRLSPFSRRLALALLAAQIVVISISLVFRSTSDFWYWLWSLNREGNIPALLASGQLMLAALVAFLAAWLCPRRQLWQRAYLAAFGLLIAILAADEAISLHERNRDLEVIYVMLGIVLLALSAKAAAHSPRQNWILHICLLAGLGIAGFGEIVVERFRRVHICEEFGFIELSECLEPYFLEEPLAFLGIWLALVALLGHLATLAPLPRRYIRLSLLLLPCLGILIVFLVLPIHQPVPPGWAQPASVVFESGTQINGYRIDSETKQVSVIMYFPVGQDIRDMGYSLHVVDQTSRESVFSHNAFLRRRYRKVSYLGHDFRPLYDQRSALAFPPDTPINHAFWIMLTLWREDDDGFVRQSIRSSDLALLDNSQVILGEIALRDSQAGPLASPLAVFDNGFRLEAVELPERALAGETLPLRFAWRAEKPGEEDFIQFLHLGHEATGEWWVHDRLPLGPRLPTRLWYAGLADSETWALPLPADLAPGRYAVFTGLYRVSDRERVPVTDAAGATWLDNRVELGGIEIES